MAMPVVHVICGPTGSGKSILAMTLAAQHGLTIVSADSRQVYRGFDIGTAKPTVADRKAVPHRGVDMAEPSERLSAARWADDATRWIADTGAHRTLVVGGTGLYVRALVTPLFDEPPLDPAARAAVAATVGAWSASELRRWVERLDPSRAHLGRAQLMRAVEVALLTGRRLSDLHRDSARAPRFRARWLVVDPGALLQEQIAGRLDAMLATGWLDEVEDLARVVAPGAPAWQACGYSAMRDVVRGAMRFEDARTAILVETRQYAKRQRTWFRHQIGDADVERIDPRSSGADAAVQAWWNPEAAA